MTKPKETRFSNPRLTNISASSTSPGSIGAYPGPAVVLHVDRRRAYSAPMTVRLLLTNTRCGQLTAIMWTS